MRVTRSIFAAGLVILLSGSLLAATGSRPKRAGKAKRVKPVAQQEVETPPQPPPPPPTPEQMPAVPSRVLYTNGQLTIVAENSTLGDVLTNLHRTTGANIDVPPGANNDRIAVRLGPGEPADVVRQLLAGSRFDYIILGLPENASALSRVIITPRGNAAVAMNAPPEQSVQSQQPVNDYAPPADLSDGDETPQPEPPQEEVNLPPEPPEGTPMPNPGSPVQQQGPKTPEQLLQELQQMQNSQNPPPVDRNPPPR